MSTSPFADDVYQPDTDHDQAGENFPDMEDALDEPNADDLMDTGYSPPEQPRVLGRFGTTESEAQAGESLAYRMRQEEPEWQSEPDLGDESEEFAVGGRRAGRIVMGDDDLHGRDCGIDGGAASAEEAAMHIVDEDDYS